MANCFHFSEKKEVLFVLTFFKKNNTPPLKKTVQKFL